MDMPFFEEGREFSNDEMRLQEVLRQLINLSGDVDFAGRIVLLAPDGEFVGDAKLSARDIETVADALMAINTYRTDAGDETGAVAPLPLAEDDLDEAAVDDVFSGFATLLGSEDGDL